MCSIFITRQYMSRNTSVTVKTDLLKYVADEVTKLIKEVAPSSSTNIFHAYAHLVLLMTIYIYNICMVDKQRWNFSLYFENV